MSLFLPLDIIVQHILLSGILPLAEVLRARRLCKRVKHGIDHSLRYWAVMYQDTFWEFHWPIPGRSNWLRSVHGPLAEMFPLGIARSLKNIAVTRQVRFVSAHLLPQDRTQLAQVPDMDVSSPIKIALAYRKILQIVLQSRVWHEEECRLLSIIMHLQWILAACLEFLTQQDETRFLQRSEFSEVRGNYFYCKFQHMWRQYSHVWMDAFGKPWSYVAYESDGTLAPVVVVILRKGSRRYSIDVDLSTSNVPDMLHCVIDTRSSTLTVFDVQNAFITALEFEEPYHNYASDRVRVMSYPKSLVKVPIHFIQESTDGLSYYRYDPITGCTNFYPYFAHWSE